MTDNSDYLVAAFYKFVSLTDFENLRQPLLEVCKSDRVMGTILVASEGINGTIAGTETGVRTVLDYIRSDPRLADLEWKESRAAGPPFHRMKVRLKKEIVTLGAGDIDPARNAGTYVEPEDWNDLIADPDVVLVDTRNAYEVDIGTFEGAVNPETNSFRDLPQWIDENLSGKSDRKIVMFCTGGIRCEKSTAFLKSQGFDKVYHLKGGILKYLEKVPEEKSRWRGECFVFDQRVSVGHGLVPGPYDLCHACRLPISETDKASKFYAEGITCPHCHGNVTENQRRRFADRQRQMELARQRRESHIAADVGAAKERKKKERLARKKRPGSKFRNPGQ